MKFSELTVFRTNPFAPVIPIYAQIFYWSLPGIGVVLLPPRSRNPDIDPLEPKDTDSAALQAWRSMMGSDWGRALYVWRGASVECANAQLRRRGLTQFNVRGKLKAKAVLLWHALAHNLMRMRSMNVAIAA